MASPAPALAHSKLTTIDLVGGIYCSICHETFKNKKDYDTHYYKHEVGTEEIVYTCVICQKAIAGYPSFRGHCYTTHVIKNRFKCDYCCKLFSKLSALNDHITALHKFQCSSCNREFPSKKELMLHKIIHMNDKPPFKCQTCNEKVSCVDACEQHIDEHSLSVYSCPICNEKTDSKTIAVNHLSVHFGDVLNETNDDSDSECSDKPEDSSIDLLGGILCAICQTFHKNRAEIDQHFSQEHPDKDVLYSCNICGNSYEKYVHFGSHCYEHISKDRFKCESCDKTFSRLARLVSHTAVWHRAGAGGGKPLHCPRCAQQFASEFRFREHQRVEHGICVIMCSQPGCGEIFETPKELILHQIQHGGASDRWCRRCGLSFRSRAAAERHLDVHRKKTFACPVCAKTYGEKYLLMKHVPQHFETVIHVCKVCGNLYGAKNRLIAHSKTHANVLNYNCSYCGKGFTSVYKLKQHQNMHTGLRPYSCVACTKTFSNYSNWFKHLQRVHKIDPKTIKKPVPEILDTDARDTKENFLNDSEPDKLQLEHVNVEMDYVITNNLDLADELDIKELRDTEAMIAAGGEMKKETYIFLEPTNEAVDLDSINPSIAPGTVSEFAVLQPAAAFFTEMSHGPSGLDMPREYGPDFPGECGRLLLDEHVMPHIDPLLTVAERRWERACLQEPYAYDRRALFNTDIF